MADNKIEDIYQGGYSSLDPNYGETFSGYRTSAGLLGTPTAPPGQQGDLPTQLTRSISTGQNVVELSLLNPEIVDSIPKPHLKETKRIAKLAGVSLSVHGPLIEASGATDRGYDKQQREMAEKQIFNTLERSHDLDSKGNISVTFHTTNGAPGAIWKKEKGQEKQIIMPLVEQETGQITVAKEEERYYPETGGDKKVHDVETTLRHMNNTKWGDSLSQVEFQREYADKILQDIPSIIVGRYLQLRSGEINQRSLDPKEMVEIKKIISAEEHVHEGQRTANSLFDKAYKYGTDKEKAALVKISKQYKKNLGIKNNGEIKAELYLNPQTQSNALFELKQGLSSMKPQLFKPAEEYTMQESTQSFGNAAWKGYKEFGEKSPILNIENPPAGSGLSRAKDVRTMVEGSRKQFVNNAMKEGMSKSQAEKQAEKLIGATWDVGHINQLRKFGFSGKDILKEAEKIAPYVKHVHLSDNFGAENTELPPGMGNVDFKGQMKKLGKKGEEAKKIVEAFHWVQSQGSSPYGVSLQAVGSPLYSMHMGPYWNQVAGLEQGYFGGYGTMLPPINYETFGAGFSNLPAELGGQRPGAGGRMSGRPME
tara:strand:- start:1585 stop:3366 length:1782 start_codon:yes stop_codon:yes gene_type:complete